MKFVPRVFPIQPCGDVGALLARLRAHRGLVALDSAAGAPRNWSLVAFDPLRAVRLPDTAGGLRAFARQLELDGGERVPGPFCGGFVGALAYDLGADGERAVDCRPDPWCSPRIVGGLYTDFIVRDERTQDAWLVLGEAPGDDRPSVSLRRHAIESALASDAVGPEDGDASSGDRAPSPDERAGPLVRCTTEREHASRIERARALIAAGEFYQVNLAHRFTRAITGEPVDIYRRLRRVNPAPYMAYLAWERDTAAGASRFPRGALLSASPELLFELEAGVARTRPIKGTAARARTSRADALAARALLASEKDRAELAMIVDLERNDLGRIARPGGVRVERFPELASYASVHHLSADVVAELREGTDAFDVLGALFPGGSITGAPKLASMAAIAALEGEGRGFFTGSLGFVDTRGQAAFNILIRTLVWRPMTCARTRGGPRQGALVRGEISYHVGGGITWSSSAADEDRETLAKGAGLAAALEPMPRALQRNAP